MPMGKADRRALNAAEITEEDLKLLERQDKNQQPATPESVPEEAEEEI